ncbi:MAG TPA: VWA domain-containing protein [Fimbriimonas sp.]|nr:VWA domain-containing protein [Fimbriimonas sp.]
MTTTADTERSRRWRLVIGSLADEPLGEADLNLDRTLEALYDSERKGGLGASSPKVARWLGDIRQFFPASVVQVMQKDALERLGLQQMLLEPESLRAVEPDVHLVSTLVSLSRIIPNKTKETARQVVRKVAEDLEKQLGNPLRQAIQGALARSVRNRRPKLREIDWHRTIKANLKNYQPEYKSIIPEIRIGYGRKGQALRDVILCLDQSGSMANSVVYAGIFGAVMASIRSIKTQVVAFDTSVVDLTDVLHDPVELLFATRLGGGTDIERALSYAQSLVQNPSDTILILISDLIEGGNQEAMIRRAAAIKASGVNFIALLALSDEGAPMHDEKMAATFAALDIPTFACTPERFPDVMAAAIKRQPIPQEA